MRLPIILTQASDFANAVFTNAKNAMEYFSPAITATSGQSDKEEINYNTKKVYVVHHVESSDSDNEGITFNTKKVYVVHHTESSDAESSDEEYSDKISPPENYTSLCGEDLFNFKITDYIPSLFSSCCENRANTQNDSEDISVEKESLLSPGNDVQNATNDNLPPSTGVGSATSQSIVETSISL